MAFAMVLFAVVALWPFSTHASAPPFTRRPPLAQEGPACVTFSTEARFVGLAYNHIVHIANGCGVPKSCTVATNVNPQPQAVTVPSGSTVDVVTFIGSPASTFTASVLCVTNSSVRAAR